MAVMNQATVQNFFAMTVNMAYSNLNVGVYGGNGGSSSTSLSSGISASEVNDTYIQIQARFEK